MSYFFPIGSWSCHVFILEKCRLFVTHNDPFGPLEKDSNARGPESCTVLMWCHHNKIIFTKRNICGEGFSWDYYLRYDITFTAVFWYVTTILFINLPMVWPITRSIHLPVIHTNGDGSLDHRQFISSLSIQLLLPLLLPLIAKIKVIKKKKNCTELYIQLHCNIT
jgi:hypothetical protein